MGYRYNTHLTSPNHSGKREKKVTSITIHWWGDPDHFGDQANDGDAEGVAKYLCRTGGTSSAHYVATANEVWCIVDPDDIAWHAGNWPANQVSIGIECDADRQPGAYKTIAELIADLREVYGDLPLVPHRRWKATACPGGWDLAKLDRMARAVAASRADAKHVSKPATPKKPKVKKINIKGIQRAVRTTADNIWGPDTDKHLKAVREAGNYYGRDFPYGTKFAQVCVGTKADGIWGPKSRKAHDRTVKRLQKALRKLGLYHGRIDGIHGPRTEAAVNSARRKSRA